MEGEALRNSAEEITLNNISRRITLSPPLSFADASEISVGKILVLLPTSSAHVLPASGTGAKWK